ncbi:hypothetical protein PybrP1_013191 [[Pythium] brassicae (nom. inval.)]|nr:hypothetical protein PybrP1_013191 [[Pythium] brassicae (nom. inval.)]
MERFFTQHSVLRDRDADELGGRVRSDSEASGASDSDEEAAGRVHSVHDPSGPWRQCAVAADSAWGQPKKRRGKPRDFRSHFTGPKGVLSDYKAHKRNVRDERARTELERRAALTRIAKGATAADLASNQHGDADDDGDRSGCDCDSDCECECECGDDDLVDPAFLRRYQQQRVQEMVAATAARRQAFGTLAFVSPAEFVRLVDDAEPQRVLLVHLFHPENYACSLLNAQLALVAQQLPHVQFAAMIAEDADESIARSDLPVLLVYRGQQLDETVVGVASALDGEFTAARVLVFVQERLASLYDMRFTMT